MEVTLPKKLALGIELGSTRIKAVLIDEKQETVASGSFVWENQLVDGVWTYGLDEVWNGIQKSYAELKANFEETFKQTLKKIDAIGFSAMMHGYLAFDKNNELLVPFRTWRNAMTHEAEVQLTELFQYNIPQRWSIAHLYQAILNDEGHLSEVEFFTTLAGYVHWQLTGEKVLGIGDASGMFPIDPETRDYDVDRLQKFEEKAASYNFNKKLSHILPKVLVAGQQAGTLTEAGAKLLDVSGDLQAGVPFCPPEGDAGTGMVATNSVGKRTGNVSAGTSIFAMIVLEKPLSKVYPEIDLVTTPAGDLVAMVHANNCSSDVNAWVGIFKDFLQATGIEMDGDTLYEKLFLQAMKGDMDAGGLLSYGYLSGENITKIPEGRPLLARTPNSNFNLANLMRVNLYTAFGALQLGMKILTQEENVRVDKIFGHGGIFKTRGVAQQILASALDIPVSVMETAGEGGAWGIAILADYLEASANGVALETYLNEKVFAGEEALELAPIAEETAGFETFAKRYQEGLGIQLAAIENLVS